MSKQMRKIVRIDEDKCDGCGQCVPSCAEGAIRIIDGKARLMAESLCDGIGNCLGTCPRDAIAIEERPADAFDEVAVEKHLAGSKPAPAIPQPPAGGCPGAMLRKLRQADTANDTPIAGGVGGASRLEQWPVQLALLPERGDLWADADVLLAADCVAYAMGDFHDRLLKGKMLAVACPKLDDVMTYVEKLTRVLIANRIHTLTIVRMEVPCCGGLERIVREALERASINLPLTVVVVGVNGEIKQINGVRV